MELESQFSMQQLPRLLLLLLLLLQLTGMQLAWLGGVSAIDLAMSVTSPAVSPGSSVRLDCAFSPAPVYIIWRYSADSGGTWQKLGLCHAGSAECSLQEPLATAWTAARPAAFINGSLALGSVGRDQDGLYECEGIGGTDAAKANRSVTVLVSPGQLSIAPMAAATSPSGSPLQLREGDPLALSCSTTGGNPPPTIAWLRRRKLATAFERLPDDAAAWTPPTVKFGATRSELRLAAAAADNLAELACRCEHPTGNFSSASVTVAVLYAPKIALVASQMVLIGDRVEFNCSADANPPARVYIARGNYTVSAIGQQSVWHAIPSVAKSDSGPYICLATNSQGASSTQFYLDVQFPPEIALLGSQSAQEGGRLVADCTVSANPPPYLVQWLHGGLPPVVINSTRLLLDPVSRSDAGQWICRAYSATVPGVGQLRRQFTAQSSIDLIVEYAPGPPEIRVSGSRAIAGQDASLVCQPSSTDPGVPVPSFSWTKFGTGGVPILTGPILQLRPASLSDNGLYYCTPENSAGRGPAASVALEVVQPPAWLAPWPQTVVTLNLSSPGASSWALDCSVSAKPEALVRWFKDGVEVDAGDFTAVSGYDTNAFRSTSVLQFISSSRPSGGLKPTDNGEFLCTAQNSFGKIDRSVQIAVEFAPAILTDTNKVALNLAATSTGSSGGLTLECLVDAQPEPSVTWELLSDGSVHVGNLVREGQPAYRYRATLPGVRQTGGYACRASNRMGEARLIMQVVTPGPPEPPSNLSVAATAWDLVALAWRPGFDGGLPATFTVAFVSLSDVERFGYAGGPHSGVTSPTTAAFSNVSGLLPDTNYAFSVRAANANGASSGNATTPLTARTAELRLPDVTGVRVSGDSTLAYSIPPDGFCVRVEVTSVDAGGGTSWSLYRRCDLAGQLDGLSLGSHCYRLSVCLLLRPNICGSTVSTQSISNLPEVSGLTIAVVASGCAVLILCLLLVLVFFCFRNRNLKANSSSDSDHFSHQEASSVERKVMQYMQYEQRNSQCSQLQHQPQPYGLVSPHPSLTSTDETSVDQGSSKVFATLVSASNPVTGPHTEGSDSDHSGSLLHTGHSNHHHHHPQQHQQQQQRKIIYEVVV